MIRVERYEIYNDVDGNYIVDIPNKNDLYLTQKELVDKGFVIYQVYVVSRTAHMLVKKA